MISHLPHWINFLFITICILTILLFHYSNGKPFKLTVLIIIWSVVHSFLAYSGFYEDTSSTPPRFGLVLVPAILLIIFGALPKQQSWLRKVRNMKVSTFLHSIRLPVEIVLAQLYVHKMVPELMTFHGRNFDIIMGISAPILAYLFIRKISGQNILLVWNCIGLCLISFILVNGLLSAELPFQQFGFEQPNRAVMYFPFILLPATIVPIVIWTHISDILLLIQQKKHK